uniref:hypothetical protein n=1 Tax=Burkholderia diffusa TaxID=488732 RepID=UPI001CC39D57|nr:hypothetical protein [Burkholderia diffusa]
MLGSSSDYMLKGVLSGLVIEAALATAIIVASSSIDSIEDISSLMMWWGITVALSLVVLLWRPVTMLASGAKHLPPAVLEDDCRAMIVGRVIGVLLGLGFGIMIAGSLI